jgi:hypothetical protein
MSVWQTFYIRVFRLDASQTLLLQEAPTANIDDASARLEPAGVLIEFSGFSVDAGILVRKYVLHYTVDADSVRRIDPIALSPQDFVEEWLARPWDEISAWTEPRLTEWHSKLHKDHVGGEYDAVRRCTKPGEWQVSIYLGDGDNPSYFSVLDRGEYRFRMLDISETPREECSGQNEMLGIGKPKPTLFPKN